MSYVFTMEDAGERPVYVGTTTGRGTDLVEIAANAVRFGFFVFVVDGATCSEARDAIPVHALEEPDATWYALGTVAERALANALDDPRFARRMGLTGPRGWTRAGGV